MDFVKLTSSDINASELMKLVSSPSSGAISMFVGTTRDNFEGKVVTRLVYEAYEAMAEKALKKLCSEIRSKWNVHGIAMYHRLGEVGVGEASVAIVVSSEHRAESLHAVQFAIDKLKAEVPIWKKEEYDESGEPKWKQNKECSWIKTEVESSSENEGNMSDTDCVDDVPQELIQVKIDDHELKRRISSFMEFKRNQINMCNIRDFCGEACSDSSCARVDAVVIRRKDSKGHLRVRRILNPTGPQTRGVQQKEAMCFRKTLDHADSLGSVNAVVKENQMQFCPPAIEERLKSAEVSVGLASKELLPVPKDVYTRLKLLEDRITFLEGISPEYGLILPKTTKTETQENQPHLFRKKVYSVSDIDRKLQELEQYMKDSD